MSDSRQRPYVSTGPLRDFLGRACRAREITLKDIAKRIDGNGGTLASRMYLPRVSVFYVDRILTALEVHPVEVYGDDWLNIPAPRCPQGHLLTEENVYQWTTSDGRPREDCAPCRRRVNKRTKQRRRAAA